ncbi:hypothetical protein DM02DRAFT_722750 [Periconia macrospinosa]|uniref:C2H2-type domain-containing protein n=1 Tax=Periconia macrospinosa TaxID=97972 RepID=A0A2V1EEC3_9PLEO|nr:hypothetical protein DM02DRAFT_722750 [Periconia macrospinosa]
MHLFINARNWTFEVISCSHSSATNHIAGSHPPIHYPQPPPPYTAETLPAESEETLEPSPDINQGRLGNDTTLPNSHRPSRTRSFRKKIGKMLLRLSRSQGSRYGQYWVDSPKLQHPHVPELPATNGERVYELPGLQESPVAWELPAGCTNSQERMIAPNSQHYSPTASNNYDFHPERHLSSCMNGSYNSSRFHFSAQSPSFPRGYGAQISTPTNTRGFSRVQQQGDHTCSPFTANADIQLHAHGIADISTPAPEPNFLPTKVSSISSSPSQETNWNRSFQNIQLGSASHSFPGSPFSPSQEHPHCETESFPSISPLSSRRTSYGQECCNSTSLLPTPPVVSPSRTNHHTPLNSSRDSLRGNFSESSTTTSGFANNIIPTHFLGNAQPCWIQTQVNDTHLMQQPTCSPGQQLTNSNTDEPNISDHYAEGVAGPSQGINSSYSQIDGQDSKDFPRNIPPLKPKRKNAKRVSSRTKNARVLPPLPCEFCDKVFTGTYQSGNRQRHVRTFHSTDLEYEIKKKCRTCDATFHRPDARRKHEWEKHNTEDCRPEKRQMEK